MKPSLSSLDWKAFSSEENLAFHHSDSDAGKSQSLLNSIGITCLNILLNQGFCDYILKQFLIKEPNNIIKKIEEKSFLHL